VQVKDRLSVAANDMDMRGPVIVGIDDDAQAIETKDSRHPLI